MAELPVGWSPADDVRTNELSAASAERRPGIVALLVDRTFGPYFVGKVMSSCGIWIQNIAAAVLMFELTRSAFMVGLVSMVQFAGPLVLALWAGGLTDRFDRRRLLMIGRIVSCVAVGGLALALMVGTATGTLGTTMLLVAVGVMGIGLAISNPAMQALVPALVERRSLEPALALNSAGGSIARTIGPAIGTGLLLLGGPALAFAAAALGHAIFAFSLGFLVRPVEVQVRPKERPPILGGLRYLSGDHRTRTMVLGVACLAFGTDPVVTLSPSLAADLGRGSETVGLFATAFGVGGVIGTAMLGPLRRLVELWLAALVGSVVVAVGFVLPLAETVAMTVAGFFLAGGGLMISLIALNTEIQRRVPDEVRGRVMALWGVAWLGSRPFAALVNGSLGDFVSPSAALLATCGFVLMAGVLALAGHRSRAS